MIIKKSADTVNLLFLDVDCIKASTRSNDTQEEYASCHTMCKVHAKWWKSQENYIDTVIGVRERIPLESSELVLGCPQLEVSGCCALKVRDCALVAHGSENE